MKGNNFNMVEISQNTKLEIAVEIIATKIAKCSRDGYRTKDNEIRNLIKEREEMYKGNEEIIDKIINIYGKEIKRDYLKK